MTFARIMLAGIAVFMLAGQINAQGEYKKVTDADVLALRLNHYFTANKAFHKPDFEWTFAKDGFVMKEGAGKISPYLMETILPKGQTASEIRGKWKLEEGRLTLSSIKADGKDVKGAPSFPIYRTAPIVVRIGDVQHVFEVMR